MEIPEYNPAAQLPQNAQVVFVGKRQTGKTFCCNDFLNQISDRIYDCTVFTGSNCDVTLPVKGVVKKFEGELNISAISRALRIQLKRRRLAVEYNVAPLSTCVWLEDLTHLKPNILETAPFHALECMPKSLNSYCFITVQHPAVLSYKKLSSSTDVAVFTQETNIDTIHSIHSKFAANIDFDRFAAIFEQCTADHKVMVVDCKCRNDAPAIYWYKAKEAPMKKMEECSMSDRVAEAAEAEEELEGLIG